MRVRRRIHGRYGHSVRLLQLHRFLVTPFTFSAALLCSAWLGKSTDFLALVSLPGISPAFHNVRNSGVLIEHNVHVP